MKTHYYQIRLSGEDYDRLADRAASAGMKRAEYIRYTACVVDPKVAQTYIEIERLLKEARRELTKQGVNLNQIARLYNTFGVDATNTTEGQLKQAIRNLNKKLEEIDEIAKLMKRKIKFKRWVKNDNDSTN